MKDTEIFNSISELQNRVNEINQMIADLHVKNVEIRIAYTEAKSGEPASINLWKAIEHNDYLTL